MDADFGGLSIVGTRLTIPTAAATAAGGAAAVTGAAAAAAPAAGSSGGSSAPAARGPSPALGEAGRKTPTVAPAAATATSGADDGKSMEFGAMAMELDDLDDGVMDSSYTGTEEDQKFDLIVGAIEDILMDPEFTSTQDTFCKAHCRTDVFEPTEENRLEYTPIFEQFTTLIEGMLEHKLKQRIEGFSMDEFLVMLEARKDQVCGDVVDMLLSLGDFAEFKHLMLSYKFAATPFSDEARAALTGTTVH